MSSAQPSQPEVTIRVTDTVTTPTTPIPASLKDDLQTVMERALAPDQRDDRFEGWTPPDGLVLALAEDQDGPIAALGGGISRGRLQLDGLIAADRATGSDGMLLAMALYRAIEPSIDRANVDAIEIWGKPADGWHRAVADRYGFGELRALHQMRCPLPAPGTPAASRPFVPGADEEALVAVNNRAFAAHPDQGGMTVADVEAAATQPWFTPDGIRLLDDPDNPGRLAGFCWTKIHEPLAADQPRLGEIYAIGIDPDHHGKGLGVPMTAAGLAWMVDQGISTGMLYVEADNTPAIRTYEKLGFVRHRTDRAWSKRGRGARPGGRA